MDRAFREEKLIEFNKKMSIEQNRRDLEEAQEAKKQEQLKRKAERELVYENHKYRSNFQKNHWDVLYLKVKMN